MKYGKKTINYSKKTFKITEDKDLIKFFKKIKKANLKLALQAIQLKTPVN